VLLTDLRVEPRPLKLDREDHWHPVMRRRDQLVRGRSDDRAALDQLALVVRLARPEPREAEGAAVLESEMDRELLAVSADGPLVEPVSDDEAAVLADQ
jgi:hypothetical protein